MKLWKVLERAIVLRDSLGQGLENFTMIFEQPGISVSNVTVGTFKQDDVEDTTPLWEKLQSKDDYLRMSLAKYELFASLALFILKTSLKCI